MALVMPAAKDNGTASPDAIGKTPNAVTVTFLPLCFVSSVTSVRERIFLTRAPLAQPGGEAATETAKITEEGG